MNLSRDGEGHGGLVVTVRSHKKEKKRKKENLQNLHLQMNCQKLPDKFLPPSPAAGLSWTGDTGQGEMDTRTRGRQVEFPPFPSPATRCGLRLGSLAAGGGAERGGHASSGLATEAFAWLDSGALCIHCTHFPGSHCHGNMEMMLVQASQSTQTQKMAFLRWVQGSAHRASGYPGMWLL